MADKKESLRNEIDYQLHYVNEKGQPGIKVLHISFVSQSIYQDYLEIVNEAQEAVRLSERMKELISQMGGAVARRKNYKDDEGNIVLPKKKPDWVGRRELARSSTVSPSSRLLPLFLA